jgi:hypothetical protein
MRRGSASFVSDMLSYAPTAAIYRHNSLVAGERVDELIRAGVEQGVFRPLNAIFAARVVALALDGIGSGELLRTTGLESGDAITALSELIVHGLSA